MSANIKKWRDSAALLLVAKQSFWTPKQSDYINYKILMMKRSSQSKFYPDTHVFPGGVIDKADCSDDWLQLYKKFGIHENSFDTFKQVKHVTPIFENSNNDKVPRYISLRICAIREVFEECGVLLCKKSNKQNQESSTAWVSYFGGGEIAEWQERVHNDPTKFIELCNTFQIYPDIWALHEWSNWLTPSALSRRYDTIFFLATVQNMPPTFAEKQEVQYIQWATPPELLEKNRNKKIYLPPPQFYELSRMVNFSNIEDLSTFSQKRAIHGCERFLPYGMATDKDQIILLPGDDLYPGEDKAQIPNTQILDALPPGGKIMHRLISTNVSKYEFLLNNYVPARNHIIPIITNTRKSNDSKL